MSKILTIDSFVSRIYNNMKQSSKRRDHTIPTFTKSQLKEWFLSQKNFKELWNNWVCSGFDRRNITVAIKGKRRKTAGGCIWKYKNNS